MRTAAYSITAVSVVNRPEKASQNRTIVKIGIELQSVDSPRQSQRIRLHRPSCPAALQKDYPGIEYEMLLGDYDEVEQWIDEGRVDCGFLRLPSVQNSTPSCSSRMNIRWFCRLGIRSRSRRRSTSGP